ncbi:beta-glucoside-specific PTS transporter subunit IIABC [Gracilibacillus timonensis]|uniref:beta-glucoside-specific PTS transporter subunit IIABC n=1 Tax=Gracilibacillus timonensis TaxID=1816696 RepID=UPI000824BF71|nr:beta-glucoside-specific PTS transporter subunit IIABC [Gracilibacillus timonensis]
MNTNQLASEIVQYIGGKENVNSYDHCSTRLRLELKDKNKADISQLEKLEGTMGVISEGNQLQIVIGNNVGVVYKEVLSHLGEINSEKNEPESGSVIQRLMQTISGIFVPIIPAIAGAGMIKALLAILRTTGILEEGGNTYYVLNFISDAPFYFLPFLLAYTSARRFKSSPVLAMCLAGVLLHPDFSQARIDELDLSIFGAPIVMANYGASVIAIILTVWIMSYIEVFAEKVVPSVIKAIFKPLTILFVTSILALVIIGPLGTIVGEGLAVALEFLNGLAPWLIPFVTGAFAPLLVMTGMHYTLVPLTTIQLSNLNHEIVMGPGFLASNMAQSATSFGVALRTKNRDMRQLSISTGITALFGITEPAMYGVTLKVKKALIAVIIGGGAGGLYAGISGLVRYSFGTPGVATLPVFIGDNPMNIVHAIVTMVLTFAVTFTAVYILGVGKDAKINITDEGSSTVEKKRSNEKIDIGKPVIGTNVDLSTIDDQVFSTQTMGPTKAYMPTEGRIVSPFNGTVSMIFPTKHAIGLKSERGVEMLIHVGIDTVSLDGKYFIGSVKEGDDIKQGQELLTFDVEKIQESGLDPTVLIVITNSTEFNKVETDTEDDTVFRIN